MKYFVTVAVLVIICLSAAAAHSVRTDAIGCHVCRTNCAKWGDLPDASLCHNKPKPRLSESTTSATGIPKAAPAAEYSTRPGSSIRIRFTDKSKAKPGAENDIAKVQSYLQQLGFDPGPVDGAMGPKTRQAIKDFQNAWGMPVDGKITSNLVAELKVIAGKK